MGKGDRRHKPRNLPDLAPVPKRIIEGKSTRRPRVRVSVETGADVHALDVRARQMGHQIKRETTRDGKPNKANIEHNMAVRREMKHPGYESDATRAICIFRQGEHRAKMLATWWAFLAVERVYQRAVLGMICEATPSHINVKMTQDKPETSADHPAPDLRDDAAKARDASNAWMHWRGLVMQLPNHLARAIFDAMHGEWELHRVEETRDGRRDAILTARGRRFVEAVEALAKVVEGKK